MRPPTLVLPLLIGLSCPGFGQSGPPDPLKLEAKIPLGKVDGRIDHMAVDLPRHRLFVAELGNNTIGVVDLDGQKVVHRITGLSEPQGVAYVQANDSLYVANGGDGSLRMYRGADYTPSGRIDLGDDADNIRIDLSANQLFVGYGKGAIAIVDLLTNNKTKTLPLKAHPESFQLDAASHQIFVNLPNMHSIALLDTSTDQESASWPLRHAANFPMALDRERKRVLVAFRSPPKLTAFDWQTGKVVGEVDICGDADDLFHDGKRKRIYISCGAGFLDVLDADRPDYARIARIHTASGARTALFVPDMDRLMLAVRAGSSEPASIWVYKPVP